MGRWWLLLTSVAVFNNGALCHVDSLAVGGGHVTQDIARGLQTSVAGAERSAETRAAARAMLSFLVVVTVVWAFVKITAHQRQSDSGAAA